MFERLTSEARTAVSLAEAEARTMNHGFVGTEHLLLGLLGEEHGVAARILRGAGVSADTVRAEVGRRVADPLVTGPDADALRAIGIDVEQIRARVEESFGPGALERGRFSGCRSGPWRGTIPLSRRSKKVMELSLREALRLRHGYIGTEHILLGLLTEGQGLAAQILSDLGIHAGDLRNAVLSALGKVA